MKNKWVIFKSYLCNLEVTRGHKMWWKVYYNGLSLIFYSNYYVYYRVPAVFNQKFPILLFQDWL